MCSNIMIEPSELPTIILSLIKTHARHAPLHAFFFCYVNAYIFIFKKKTIVLFDEFVKLPIKFVLFD